MRFNLTSGSVFNGLAIIGTGMVVTFPDQKWVGAVIIIVGLLSLIFDVKLERGHIEIGSPRSFWKRVRAMSGQVMMLVGGLIFIVGALWTFWPTSSPPKPVFVPQVLGIWASDDEIERFRKLKRILVRYSPERLAIALFNEGEPAISAYRDNWVKISHAFASVVPDPEDSPKLLVQFSGSWPHLFADFDATKWKDKLLGYSAGQTINAACQISFRHTPGRTEFRGYNCELVNWN